MHSSKLILILLTLASNITLAQKVKLCKNVNYVDSKLANEANRLDVYYPSDTSSLHQVLVFVHGGSWDSGHKETYRLMGKNLARRGVVAVMINYTLSPDAQIDQMVNEVSSAVSWASTNIHHYGGDTSRIILAGHSAGGHLAAMAAFRLSFVSKVALIDAFGLDMVDYFNNYDNKYSRGLFNTFTDDPFVWEAYSPIYHIPADFSKPWLILTGGRTFPTIKKCNRMFIESLQANDIAVTHHVFPKKKHIPMITQFFHRNSEAFRLLMDFLN